ncbi:Pef1p [Sugiyamaella lignohabitans]|uniref:Pef1p n=1 Tax=Sugiyamaella lignohabitans TaxID=796027 RepID=A0A167CZ25_9ASCO|nr:Pef1p [Sugiyamaella lignohabitans]ANB12279.1 Pef1p [Sugiyamaella lignohabitans]
MGDELPRFPTPGETFGVPTPINDRPIRRSGTDDYFNSGGIPPLPVHRQRQTSAPHPTAYDYQVPYPDGQGQSSMYASQYGRSAPAHTSSYPPPPPPPNMGGSGGGGGGNGGGVAARPSRSPRQSPRGPQVPISTPEANLRQLFHDVDRNKNGYLTESELKSALVNGDYTRFDRETVRLMIRMFDVNGDGAIQYNEFAQLWRYLHEWRVIFNRFDRDKSDSISINEFHTALVAFGYSLSQRCTEYIFSIYAKLDRRGVAVMSFDVFVQSCIHIKSVTESFKKFDTDRDGYITLAFEQFLVEVSRLR